MNKIRVLIADDHTIVRIGLAALLGTQPDIEVVGEAEDGDAAVRGALKTHPDIVIMDLMMPRKDGAAATVELRERLPSAKVIVLTSYVSSDGIAHALEAGACGAIVKTADDSALLAAIRKVAAGETFISPQIRKTLRESPPVPELTDRQREIISSMARGLSNADIATLLGISPSVAREHISTILNKLGAATRTEAVAIALRKQLLKI